MKKGVWRRVNCSPYDHCFYFFGTGAFVNGVIHWVARSREDDTRYVILAFDFVQEVFYEIPAPISQGFDSISVIGGSLCIVATGCCNRGSDVVSGTSSGSSDDIMIDFWTLKEYGNVESWTKFSVYTDEDRDLEKTLCLIGDEELLLVTGRPHVHNLKDGSFKPMIVDGVELLFYEGITFTDSLVSPAFGNQIEGNNPL